MEENRLLALISGEDKTKLLDKIKAQKQSDNDVELYIKQYDPLQHDVFDESIGKRPKNKVEDENGKTTGYVDVNRIAVPLQKMIVSRAAQFLAGNPIQLDCPTKKEDAKNFLAVIQKIWDDNKLDYKTKQICKKMKSETEAAEIWYAEDVDSEYWNETIAKGGKFTLRMRMIAKSLKDDLYPVFNGMNDLVAFGRGYKQYNEEDELIDVFDLYTKTMLYKFRPIQGGWLMIPEKHGFDKIPVIYYYQEQPEWWDVQAMISRLETLLSNHADTNDRVGAPMVKITGDLSGMDKTALGQVRVLKMKNGGDAEYLTWNSAPESIKLEIEQLWKLIHVCSDTPDTSPDTEKGLGQVSGVALEMRFFNAHLKAADGEEIFGEYIQRRINFLKSGAVSINNSLKKYESLRIKPKFSYFMPANLAEKVDLLVTAVQGGIMAKETATKNNPLVENGEDEWKLVQGEAEQAQQRTDKEVDDEMNNEQ